MGAPSKFSHPYLSLAHPIPFAHRGGTSQAPENSLLSFSVAVGLGYQYLETDVHATSDGILVAFHDERLDRLTDSHGLIRELTYSEIQKALIDGREPIPTMRELLVAFPAAHFNIDAKHETSVQPLANLLKETDCLDRVLVGSFSDTRLRALRELLGESLATSMGPRAIVLLSLAAFGVPWRRFRAVAAQVPIAMLRRRWFAERLVRAAHQRGIAVHVWTVDDADDMRYLLDLGVDGIMTDEIHILKAVFEDRQIW
ncbi:MAG: glycerophosphodiester phosphodiesterase [Acidimicrobiales bacterium]